MTEDRPNKEQPPARKGAGLLRSTAVVSAMTLLSRVLGLICLGDWVSYYLAVGTGVDPYPIEKINLLKAALEGGK